MSSSEEDKYFQKQEAQRRADLREKLNTAADATDDRSRVASALGTTDDAIVQRLKALHFDGDTARVFDLMPLIHVAWADGSVSKGERTTILEVLRDRGIRRDSEAFRLVEALLEERPSTSFMDQTLNIMREVFESGHDRAGEIVKLCVEVAEASGGLWVLTSSVSGEERDALKHIADVLGPKAAAAFSKFVAN